MTQATIEQLDALLPQTQCGDCGFAGCKPYAQAMAASEADIDLCPPGGERVLKKLATLLKKDVTQYQLTPKPLSVAIIDEPLCIGCTKCIQACPVDAISGATKLMHTVISDECTGCNLCVEPCPMDCIEMRPLVTFFTDEALQHKADHARQRFETRNQRITNEAKLRRQKHQDAKLVSDDKHSLDAKKLAIQAAVARAKAKRGQRDT